MFGLSLLSKFGGKGLAKKKTNKQTKDGLNRNQKSFEIYVYYYFKN